MNRNLFTLAIAVLSLGLGGVAVANEHTGNQVHTTSGADSATSAHTDPHKRFNEMDSNKDGKLSKNELETSDKGQKFIDKWSTIDTNQDGSIDQSEYSKFKSAYGNKNRYDDGSTIRDGNSNSSQGMDRTN